MRRCRNCRWATLHDGGVYCLPSDEFVNPDLSCRYWEEGPDVIKIFKHLQYKTQLSSVYGIFARKEDNNGTDKGES